MSATDEHEIKLEPRYPESRLEDITDAFMRGHLNACETSFKEIKELEAMNKRLRKENDTLCHRIDELCRENEKLMGELAEWERLAAGIELPEYPITEFKPKDLERENAKLREYATKAWSLFIRHGAVHECDLSEVDAVRDGLRELGIEVDE